MEHVTRQRELAGGRLEDQQAQDQCYDAISQADVDPADIPVERIEDCHGDDQERPDQPATRHAAGPGTGGPAWSSPAYTECVRSATTARSNSSTASRRDASPKRCRSAASRASVSTAAASASTPRGGTRKPFRPCRTTSFDPGESAATSGNPIAAASSSTRGIPSR